MDIKLEPADTDPISDIPLMNYVSINNYNSIEVDFTPLQTTIKQEVEDDYPRFEGHTKPSEVEIEIEVDPLRLSMASFNAESAINNALIHRPNSFNRSVDSIPHRNDSQISSPSDDSTNERIAQLRRSTLMLQLQSSQARRSDCSEPYADAVIKKEILENKKVPVLKLRKIFNSHRYFICDICFVIHDTCELLADHKGGHNELPIEFVSENASRVICDACEFNCPNVNARKKRVVVDGEPYVCVAPWAVTGFGVFGIFFKCNFCEYICRFKIAYRRHVAEHFYSELLQCDDCAFSCVEENELQKHRILNHNSVVSVNLLNCYLCELNFVVKNDLDTHRLLVHNMKQFKCGYCSLKFDRRSEVEKHKIIVHNHVKRVDYLSCDFCELKFSYKKDVNAHKLAVHNIEKPYKCEICPYECKLESELRKHRKRHSDEKPYGCELCDYKSKIKGELNKHRIIHSDVKPFCCDLCDYRCKVKADLNKHKITHTDEKPFKCTECPIACRNQRDLTRHIMTHSGEHPFRCTMCAFKSTTASKLKTHQMTHTGETPLSCHLCSFKCRHSSSMKRHVGTQHHINEISIVCELCPYRCVAQSDLKTHMLKHTGEKPFLCDLCPFKTTRTSSLKLHRMMHTGEKPLECDVCEYKCRYHSNMTKHKMVHSGVANYECDVCLKRFKRSGHLNKHKASQHND